MLSFEKCKELFDAGLRREKPRLGDLYYFDGGVVCIITANDFAIELIRCDSLNERAAFMIYEIVRDDNFLPIFTMEEILFAIREVSPVGIMVGAHVTIESSCDMYLGIMKMSVPEKPLEIKLGGIYRTREGGVAMVYAIFKDDPYPVRAIDLGHSTFLVLTDVGRYLASGAADPVDLVLQICTIDQITWSVGDPMWRRKSDGTWVRGVVNETYLELIKEDPYSYAPVVEGRYNFPYFSTNRFVSQDIPEAELKRQAFIESMRKW